MVNVQKHGTIMVHVKAQYYHGIIYKKTRYYQTGVHKKHSITRVTYKKYCISLAPPTKNCSFNSNIIIFYVYILLQLFLHHKTKIINAEK